MNGVQSVVRRLVLRSAQCYAGYQLTVVASFLGGYLTAGEASRALLLLDTSHFGNILRFYSIALLLAIPLIRARLHWGVRVYGLLLILLWIVPKPLEGTLAAASFGSYESLAGLLFGIGAAPVGPSVWHGMTFVLAGMLVGTSLTGWNAPGFRLRAFYASSAVVMAITALVVLVLVRESSPAISRISGTGLRITSATMRSEFWAVHSCSSFCRVWFHSKRRWPTGLQFRSLSVHRRC